MRHSRASGLPLPTFLIIGAQKSATRWLRQNLGRHPEIFTADKELSFWNHGLRYRELGVDWYREQFSGWDGEPIVGEATPGYMMLRHKPRIVAHRMKQYIPDVKLIAILRNPIDRANSAMVHHIKRDRLPPDVKLLDIVKSGEPKLDWLGLVSGGLYAQSLRPFRNAFGDNLLILFHDDVREDASAVYQTSLRHIGADPEFVPPGLEQMVFSNQEGDGRDRRKDPREISPADRRELYEYFRDDIRHLQRMTGRDLSIWKPGPVRKVRPTRPVTVPPPLQFIDRYDCATTWVAALVEGATRESVAPPIRELLQHLTNALSFYAAILRRETVPDGAPPDFAVASAVAAYQKAAADFRAAMTAEGALQATIDTPLGPTTAQFFARLVVFDQLANGWNLKVQTGQGVPLGRELHRLAELTVKKLKTLENGESKVALESIEAPVQPFVDFLREYGSTYSAYI